MKPGIQRICITDKPKGRGSWRFEESKKRWPLAEVIYRETFDRVNPLLPGIEYLPVTQQEFEAGYDKFFGVDIVLNHQSGMASTLQEKILFQEWQTVTVEYMNDPVTRESGDWFNLRVDYYFVGYDRERRSESIQEWILLDWRETKEKTGIGKIAWKENPNKNDGARASFKYAPFNAFPVSCVIAAEYTRPENPKLKTFTPEELVMHERNSIIRQISQSHLNPGMSLVRLNEIFDRHGIKDTKDWDRFNLEQLKQIQAEAQ